MEKFLVLFSTCLFGSLALISFVVQFSVLLLAVVWAISGISALL